MLNIGPILPGLYQILNVASNEYVLGGHFGCPLRTGPLGNNTAPADADLQVVIWGDAKAATPWVVPEDIRPNRKYGH
ncbi:hypothetical protein Clacol_004048 [Clathrus columnatus]|uniref:Uncharacterized protein n=1 Tax=Clathrus columnatus TaxID=1419009 RepID=A0AAV5A5D2_9AGAM|nr:hypothetical protein Clacol_004048 [Clathrus columnatus]